MAALLDQDAGQRGRHPPDSRRVPSTDLQPVEQGLTNIRFCFEQPALPPLRGRAPGKDVVAIVLVCAMVLICDV